MGKNFNRNTVRKVARYYSSSYRKSNLCKSRAPIISLSTNRKQLKDKELKDQDKKLEIIEGGILKDISDLRTHLRNLKEAKIREQEIKVNSNNDTDQSEESKKDDASDSDDDSDNASNNDDANADASDNDDDNDNVSDSDDVSENGDCDAR